tara:strand:+ start:79 stop:429 length:351 start_codon:yes stop_codon:yes gene_type:complete
MTLTAIQRASEEEHNLYIGGNTHIDTMVNQIKNPETVGLSITQTAKGFWYVDRLKAEGGDVASMIQQLDTLTRMTLERLHALNNPEEGQEIEQEIAQEKGQEVAQTMAEEGSDDGE